MPAREYESKPRGPGTARPIDCNCHICGVKKGEACWDMRWERGKMRRARPHHQRGMKGPYVIPAVAKRAEYGYKTRLHPSTKGRKVLHSENVSTLHLIAAGMTHQQIAHQMGISYPMSQRRIAEVLWRMGAKCMAHAVHLAYQAGILQVDDSQFPVCAQCLGPIKGRDIRARFCDDYCQNAADRKRQKGE